MTFAPKLASTLDCLLNRHSPPTLLAHLWTNSMPLEPNLASTLDEPTACHLLPPLLAHLSNQPLAMCCHSWGTNLLKLAPYLASILSETTFCHLLSTFLAHLMNQPCTSHLLPPLLSQLRNHHLLRARTLTCTLDNLLELLSICSHLQANFDEPSTFHFQPSLLEHCMSLLLYLLAIKENIYWLGLHPFW
jgi:hypothetical protein